MHLKSAIAFFTFFILIFLHFLLLVDPRIIYHAQEPAFLTGAEFFREFAAYPGGLAWYASAYLTQWYQFSWSGALIMTLAVFLVYWQAAWLCSLLGIKGIGRVVAAVPALAVFTALCDYRFPLSYAIGLAITLVSINGYLFRPSGNWFVRLARYGALVAMVYYCAGTGALFFAAACGLHELLYRRNFPGFAITAAIGAALPLVAARFAFVLSIPSAYNDFAGVATSLLAAGNYPRMPALLYVAYGVVGMAIIIGYVTEKSRIRSHALARRLTGHWQSVQGFIVMVVVLMGAMAGAAALGLDEKARQNYRIDRYARNGMWNRIIEAMPPDRMADFTILSQAHLFRALYYDGRLLSELFRYQNGLPGKAFVAVTGPMARLFPAPMSDCCFEIGGLSQAEFWAHEALAVQGKKPWLLRRLALINMVKGRNPSAEKFIVLLEKTPFCRSEARRYRRYLKGEHFDGRDRHLETIRSYLPAKEYLCQDYYSELVNLFECNSGNRIAFEYIVAHNLMNNFVSPVIDNMGYFAKLGYRELPLHVKEAAVLQLSLSGGAQATISGFSLESAMFGRLTRFNQLFYTFGNNREAALSATMAGYGSTYWYYLMSTQKPVILKQDH
ncbi:MAG: hypothetical protein JXA71_01210 [Chitinispirillaceae bacterium]|nr:hypothetical protein [Chitinispirillaceae bacterium]